MSSTPPVIEPTVRDSAAVASPDTIHNIPFTTTIAPITDSAAVASPDTIHNIPFTTTITRSVGDEASVR